MNQETASNTRLHDILVLLKIMRRSVKYPENLAELVKEGDDKWPGPFLDQTEVPKDQWGREFKYEIVGKRVRITSAGPDGQFATPDDLWNK